MRYNRRSSIRGRLARLVYLLLTINVASVLAQVPSEPSMAETQARRALLQDLPCRALALIYSDVAPVPSYLLELAQQRCSETRPTIDEATGYRPTSSLRLCTRLGVPEDRLSFEGLPCQEAVLSDHGQSRQTAAAEECERRSMLRVLAFNVLEELGPTEEEQVCLAADPESNSRTEVEVVAHACVVSGLLRIRHGQEEAGTMLLLQAAQRAPTDPAIRLLICGLPNTEPTDRELYPGQRI